MKNSVATNRKAGHDYALFDRVEAGIMLKGPEIKSIRDGKVNLNDSFVRITNDEAYVYGMHISPYKQSGQFAPEPTRERKLLLHKKQILKLSGLTLQKGYTIVPTKLYFKGSNAKLEIAVAKGKKFFDKREKLRRQESERRVQRSLKNS